MSFLFGRKKKDKNPEKPAKPTKRDEKMTMALFTTAKCVSNRNPQSRGQGLSGESKAAILQMLRDDD